jgi:hypothetical protein
VFNQFGDLEQMLATLSRSSMMMTFALSIEHGQIAGIVADVHAARGAAFPTLAKGQAARSCAAGQRLTRVTASSFIPTG